jgi:hypothetical protein
MLMEARGLLLRGWSRGAQARDRNGTVVAAWSEDASSWSLLGSLLATWRHQNAGSLDQDVVAHTIDVQALGHATAALSEIAGPASLEEWNDEPGRTITDVIAAIDDAVQMVDGA